MTYIKSLGLAAAVAIAGAASANAATYATTAAYDLMGSGLTPDRSNPANALGSPDSKFMSLGLGGIASFTFGTLFGSPATTFEVTFGNRANYPETADVWGFLNGVGTYLGWVDNNLNTSVIFAGTYDTLQLRDTTTGVSTDGFDVDAVSVSAVPVPAAGILLVGALGGLAALRRRKSA